MSSVDTEHRRLCHALLDAIEQGELAAVDACYARDMTMWFNVTGQESSREENLTALTAGKDLHRRRTYDDRQINTFDEKNHGNEKRLLRAGPTNVVEVMRLFGRKFRRFRRDFNDFLFHILRNP